MLANSKLMAFASTKDPAKAKVFYGETLGLKLTSEDSFGIVFDSNGVMLRVSIVQDFTPQPFTVLGWQVTDIRADLRMLVAKGVAFERYGFVKQDEDGVWTTDDGAQVAWFKDPDGNLLSLTQFPNT